jgi:hypothetical protein
LESILGLGIEMKHSFQLTPFRRANVWIDEAPPTEYVASSIVRTVVMPRTAIDIERTIACVEVNFFHGARSSYALLGAELIEAESDGFEVCVSVNGDGPLFGRALARGLDEVRIGLPSEYAQAVISRASRFAESIAAPSKRKLWFRWAAHGLVGSSPLIFEQVSGIVAQLLFGPSVWDESQIRALFENLPTARAM